MPTIGELCNRDVVVIHASERVVEAAQRMRTYHVRSVVVVEERRRPRGTAYPEPEHLNWR
jgi:CBS domain-containing protein